MEQKFYYYIKQVFNEFKEFFLTNVIISFLFLGVFFFIDTELLRDKISEFTFLDLEVFLILIYLAVQIIIFTYFVYKKIIPKKSTRSLLQNIENNTLEFKSSLNWDYKQQRTNKELRKPVLKTICSFMNTKGGTLLIGVDDSGKVLGLEKDFQLLHKKDEDGFMQQLTKLCKDNLEVKALKHIDITTEPIRNKIICRVDISPSKSPIFLEINGTDNFFIRVTNISVPLSPKETHMYLISRKNQIYKN